MKHKLIDISPQLEELLEGNGINTVILPEPIILSLTHKSTGAPNSDRLEFLGDGVLNVIVKKYLFNQFPQANVSNLAKTYSRLVSNESLAIIGQAKLNLNACIKSSNTAPKIVADSFESLVGALSIILSDKALSKVVLDLIIPPYIEEIICGTSFLQIANHYAQKITYSTEGNNQMFTCTIRCKSFPEQKFTAKNKTAAEEGVAALFLLNNFGVK